MKDFNIVISGVGGQGVMMLQNIIAEAALKQKYDVKTSELHGLSQRGGGISSHIRFGDKIYSPLVSEGGADLIISLEPLEALRVSYYASKESKTVFLANSESIFPLSVAVLKDRYPSLKSIKGMLKKFSSRVLMPDASTIVKKETGDVLATNIFLLGYACGRKLLPIRKGIVIGTMKEIIPEKYFELNRRVFGLGCK